ncbi:amidohydrolase family protein [Bradyrhizobium sp. ORS 86]|uniref:amidohydrolase family protein n=1 Tax=Bradyrhizobium sp. ORS 86 TaxID=1685970 RepID=UPI00388E6420
MRTLCRNLSIRQTGQVDGVSASNPSANCSVGALSRLLQDFPDTRFVLVHIGRPYEKEFRALTKHYRKVIIDISWAGLDYQPGGEHSLLQGVSHWRFRPARSSASATILSPSSQSMAMPAPPVGHRAGTLATTRRRLDSPGGSSRTYRVIICRRANTWYPVRIRIDACARARRAL